MKYYILLLTFISTTLYAQDLSPQNGVTTSVSIFYVLKNEKNEFGSLPMIGKFVQKL